MKKIASIITAITLTLISNMGAADTPKDLEDGLPYLLLLVEPEPVVSFSTRALVQAAFRDPDNLPIPDTFIAFDPLQDTADTVLSSRNALTDSEGVAETFIEAGVQEVDFDIKISVPEDDSVDPVYVRVRVRPETEPAWTVGSPVEAATYQAHILTSRNPIATLPIFLIPICTILLLRFLARKK